MIAAWMLYCSLCALVLSVATALAERALLAGRGPVRLVWIGAVALSLLVPILALRFAPRPGVADSKAGASRDVARAQVLDTALPVSAQIAEPQRSTSSRDWGASLARFDQPLAVAWVTLSLALAFNFVGGIITLAWMRRKWQRRIVLGVPVFVSERTGPAVVGAVSPAIVLPEWALVLEPAQLALMLRHEQEHQRAGDGRLLAAAEVALMAMPWNLALWWQILRLRVAVELDCDARVLQDADARSYGDLLLEVARPRRGPSLMGATAFAERATQLDRRIRVLARYRVRTSRAARALATCTGLAALTVAWVAPRPPAPPRALNTPEAPALAPTPVERAAQAPPIPAASNTDTTSDAKAKSKAAETPSAETPKPDSATRVELPAAIPSALPRSPTPGGGQDVQESVEVIFQRLFEGITLPPDQAAKARDLLRSLQLQQITLDEIRRATLEENRPKTVALQARRDSALRALLTNDADRATFDARLAPYAGGARGRSGGPPPDSSAGGRRGGGEGGRGGGRGGRGAGEGLAVADVVVLRGAVMTELTFRRLFSGIPLTADQEASARALISETEEEVSALTPRPAVRFRMNWNTGDVWMPAESTSALLALVSNDADRAIVQSRIVSMR